MLRGQRHQMFTLLRGQRHQMFPLLRGQRHQMFPLQRGQSRQKKSSAPHPLFTQFLRSEDLARLKGGYCLISAIPTAYLPTCLLSLPLILLVSISIRPQCVTRNLHCRHRTEESNGARYRARPLYTSFWKGRLTPNTLSKADNQ